MGRQAFVTLLAKPAALVLGNRLLLILHGLGQSQGRIGRLVRVAKIQTQLIGVAQVAFAPVAKPLLHQSVEGQLVLVTLLRELCVGLVLELQRHVLLPQLLALRCEIRVLVSERGYKFLFRK